jgi:hypothetical protein
MQAGNKNKELMSEMMISSREFPMYEANGCSGEVISVKKVGKS